MSHPIRVFPRKTRWTPTDDGAVIGGPTLYDPVDRYRDVLVSCVFTWDLSEARRLQRAWAKISGDVRIGGPALDDFGGPFISGRFVKKGVTITSRGCPRHCPWCFAWRREGGIRILPIVPGNIIEDNNLLACPRRHLEAVFEMLSDERGVVFSGGLDPSLLADWHRDFLETIRYRELWFAADTRASLKSLQRAAEICAGISIEKLRCYALIGFGGESVLQAEQRLEQIYALGFLPFAQLYRGEQAVAYSAAWKALARKWSRPAAYRISAGAARAPAAVPGGARAAGERKPNPQMNAENANG